MAPWGFDPTLGQDVGDAFDQSDLARYLRLAGIPQQPASMPQPTPSPRGPFGIPGGPLDNASMAVLEYLKNAPQPQGFGQNFAAGLAGGFAGTRARGATQRQEADKNAREETEKVNHGRELARMRWAENKLAREERAALRPVGAEAATMVDIPGVGKVPATSSLARDYLEGSGKVKRPPSSINENFDAGAAADRIYRGFEPPVSTGYSRGQWGQVVTAMEKRHPEFNTSRANLIWTGTQTFVKSQNSRQQYQLHTSATAAQSYLDDLEKLNDKLTGLMPRGAVVPINQLALGGTRNLGLYGPEAVATAQEMNTLLSNLEPDLANVYRAGGVPTDQADALVARNFNAAMNPIALKASVRKEGWALRQRINAINNAVPVTIGGQANPYVPDRMRPPSDDPDFEEKLRKILEDER
jgi:hypothetical protein